MALPSQISAALHTPKPPVGIQSVDGYFLDTVEDATEEQWRAFGVRLCAHALNTGMDRGELREALIILGVAPDPYPSAPRSVTGRQRPPRGWCEVCQRSQSITLGGLLYSHPNRAGDDHCAGSGTKPGSPEVAA